MNLQAVSLVTQLPHTDLEKRACVLHGRIRSQVPVEIHSALIIDRVADDLAINVGPAIDGNSER